MTSVLTCTNNQVNIREKRDHLGQDHANVKVRSMTDTFYRDFEARFRGDPSLIRERLRVYQPFLSPLAAQKGDAQALDLGCGRGEWLEILEEAGLSARGVDIDKGMLDIAHQKGLAVEQMEALPALKALPDNTLALVSAFHLIEHLPFDDIRELVTEAHRVLRPGGLLILETPNPENPLVSLVNFHLDPTHLRPLPPGLTSFLTEHVGFERNVILRLQGSEPREETAAHLISLFTDVSLDYAVVAQVDGPEIGALDEAFSLRIGMDLIQGVYRFDRALSEIHRALGNVPPLATEVSSLRGDIMQLQRAHTMTQVQPKRGALEKMLFRTTNGRPVRTLRRLLFHASGKPRGIFRRWVLNHDGSPRRQFQQWMASPEYLALHWPTSQRLNAAPKSSEDDGNGATFLSGEAEISTTKWASPEPFVQNSELVMSRGAEGGHWITHRNDSVIGGSLRQTGQFQEHAIDDVMQILAQNGHEIATSCFVDIGANIGSHSIHAARRGFDRVIAFEPDPQNFRLLRANTFLHDVDHKVSCHQMAVSDRNGTMQMELSPSNFGDHRLRVSGDIANNLHDEGDWILQDVPVRTFDSLVEDGLLPEDGPDLIWIDTQGHEGHVLACAKRMATMRCPVVLEFWPYGLERSGGYKMLRDAIASRDDIQVIDLGTSNPNSLNQLSLDALDQMYEALRQGESKAGSPHTDLLLMPNLTGS